MLPVDAGKWAFLNSNALCSEPSSVKQVRPTPLGGKYQLAHRRIRKLPAGSANTQTRVSGATIRRLLCETLSTGGRNFFS